MRIILNFLIDGILTLHQLSFFLGDGIFYNNY